MHVLYGSANGIAASGSQLWQQNSSGIADAAELSDGFGELLAAANFGKSAQADLAIGIPLENVGSVVNAGAVNIIYGTSTGLASAGNQFWHQNSSGIANSTAEGDQFGDALAAANFGKTAQADLAIGVPGETVGAEAPGRRRPCPVRHLDGTLVLRIAVLESEQLRHPRHSGIAGPIRVCAVGRKFRQNQRSRSGRGRKGESIGGIGAAGAVNVIYGTSTGLASSGNQFWHQSSSGSPDRPRTVTISGRRWLPKRRGFMNSGRAGTGGAGGTFSKAPSQHQG